MAGKTIGVVIAVVFVSLLIFAPGCKKKEGVVKTGIAWLEDYDTAVKLAGEKHLPILVAFHAEWCHWCDVMKKDTYTDQNVIELMKGYVPVMIDTDKQQQLARKFHVQGLPSFVVLGSDGTELATLAGYMPAKEFIQKLKAIDLDGK